MHCENTFLKRSRGTAWEEGETQYSVAIFVGLLVVFASEDIASNDTMFDQQGHSK